MSLTENIVFKSDHPGEPPLTPRDYQIYQIRKSEGDEAARQVERELKQLDVDHGYGGEEVETPNKA